MPMLWHRRGDAAKTVEGLHVGDFEESKLAQVLGLIRSCAALSEAVVPYSVASFRAAYLGPGSHPERDITVLTRRHRAVGVSLMSTKRQYLAGGRAYMEVLYVEPRYPGRGPIHTLVETARAKLLGDDLPLEGMFTFLDDRTMRTEQSYLEDMGFSRVRRCRYLVFTPPRDYPRPALPRGVSPRARHHPRQRASDRGALQRRLHAAVAHPGDARELPASCPATCG